MGSRNRVYSVVSVGPCRASEHKIGHSGNRRCPLLRLLVFDPWARRHLRATQQTPDLIGYRFILVACKGGIWLPAESGGASGMTQRQKDDIQLLISPLRVKVTSHERRSSYRSNAYFHDFTRVKIEHKRNTRNTALGHS